MHSIIALITPSMVWTWSVRFGPWIDGVTNALFGSCPRTVQDTCVEKSGVPAPRTRQDGAHLQWDNTCMEKYDVLASVPQDVLIANGSYIQGRASKLMLGPCKNNGDPIKRADAARKMFRKSSRKNQCETPRNDFAAPDWQWHAWQSAGLTSHPDPTMSTFYNKNIDVWACNPEFRPDKTKEILCACWSEEEEDCKPADSQMYRFLDAGGSDCCNGQTLRCQPNPFPNGWTEKPKGCELQILICTA